jgi:hypothetical protein
MCAAEINVTEKPRPVETDGAEDDLLGIGVPDGIEEQGEVVLSDGSAAVIQIASRSQLREVGGTVIVAEVVQASAVRINPTSEAAFMSLGRRGDVSATRPGRRGIGELRRHIRRRRSDTDVSSALVITGRIRASDSTRSQRDGCRFP